MAAILTAGDERLVGSPEPLVFVLVKDSGETYTIASGDEQPQLIKLFGCANNARVCCVESAGGSAQSQHRRANDGLYRQNTGDPEMKTPPPTRKTRVLLADDHAIVREGLKFLLNQQPDMTVVAEAVDGEDAFQQARKLLPDVVVMDVSMPRCNGMQATERLKQACPKVKVLALTAHENLDYLRQLLKAGASGYVTKRSAAMELTRAIRTVTAGEVYLDATAAGILASDMAGRLPSGDARTTETISPREIEVLRDIARGYSNKEIGARLQISVKTVETYKARLMKKLKLQSRVDIVRYASHQGWLEEN